MVKKILRCQKQLLVEKIKKKKKESYMKLNHF